MNYNISLPQKHHIMPDTLTLTSVHTIPGAHASAAFTSKTSEIFKEEHNIAPIIINDKMRYIPWGGDNQMPYTELATAQVQAQVDDFMLGNGFCCLYKQRRE